MSLDSAEKTLKSCRVISFESSEWRADAFVITTYRRVPHHVNGCCAPRSRLHYPACRTTADRMVAYRKSDQRRDDLCAGGLRKRAREWLAVAAG